MSTIATFNIVKQDESMSCWLAVSRSILDYYVADTYAENIPAQTQKEMAVFMNKVSKQDKIEPGQPDKILLAAGALKKVEKVDGDIKSKGECARLQLMIKDSIDAGNPIILGMKATSKNIGHAIVIYKYEQQGNDLVIFMQDPGNPKKVISGKFDEVMTGFEPYKEKTEAHFYKVFFYTTKLIFAEKPQLWGLKKRV